MPSVLWQCWLGSRKGIWPVKKMGDGGCGHWLVRMEWRPAGWSLCLPPLIFPCTIKSRSSLLAPAHPGGSGKRAIKRLWVWWCCQLLHSFEKNSIWQGMQCWITLKVTQGHWKWCCSVGHFPLVVCSNHRSVLNILDPLLASQAAAEGVVTIVCRIEIQKMAEC